MKDAPDSLVLILGLVLFVFVLTILALGFVFGGIEHAPLP